MDCMYIPSYDCVSETTYTFDIITSLVGYFGTLHDNNWHVLSTPLTIKTLQSMTMISNSKVTDILRDYLECVADSSFLVHTHLENSLGKVKPKEVPDWTYGSLKSNEESQLQKMIAELNKRVNKHRSLLDDIRRTQTKIWDREQNVKRRTAVLNAYTNKMKISINYKNNISDNSNNNNSDNSNNVTKQLTDPRLESHKAKLKIATQLLQKSQTKFQQRLQTEKTLIEELKQLEVETRSFFTEAVVKRLENNLVNMVVALTKSELHERLYQNIILKLSKINIHQIAHALYDRSSRKYTFPVIEEFMKFVGFGSKIPRGEIGNKETYLFNKNHSNNTKMQKNTNNLAFYNYDGDEEFLLPMEELEFGNEKPSFNLNNGFYVQAKGNTHSSKESNLCGFLFTKKGQIMKQKLCLIDGKIGFGWTRKNRFASKRWGFFNTCRVCRASSTC